MAFNFIPARRITPNLSRGVVIGRCSYGMLRLDRRLEEYLVIPVVSTRWLSTMTPLWPSAVSFASDEGHTSDVNMIGSFDSTVKFWDLK
jgi:hypothetical protein